MDSLENVRIVIIIIIIIHRGRYSPVSIEINAITRTLRVSHFENLPSSARSEIWP